MDVQSMQIFARVAALQSFSATAVELGLTPATISKSVQALEHDLSVRLFDRTTRSIRITAEGSAILMHVEHILKEINTLRAAVAEVTSTTKGSLKIAAPNSIGSRIIMPAILRFLPTHPDIKVQVDFFDRSVHLLDEGYDVAIHVGALTDSSIIAKRLAPDRVVVVASPDYLSQHGRPEVPADLARHPCLVHGEPAAYKIFMGGADTHLIKRHEPLRSASMEMLRLAAKNGLGLLFTSEIQVADEMRTGRLVSVFQEYRSDDNFGVYALYPSGRHVLPRLRAFLDFLSICFHEASLGSPSTNKLDVSPDCDGINVHSPSN